MADTSERPIRVLSLGWGVQSWTLAAMAALGELPPVDYAVHADTRHEAAGTYAHARKWTPWLEEHGVHVVTVRGDRTDVVREDWSNSVLIPAFTLKPPQPRTVLEWADQGDDIVAVGERQVLDDGRGQVRRQCTHDWKITPIRRFLRPLLPPSPPPGAVEMLQGISWDESLRMRDSDVRYVVNAYPLVDLRITRKDCILWLESHGLDVPVKSGCVFCPYNSIARWKGIKRAGGADWNRAMQVDRAIRDKRPGFKLFVHPHRKELAEAVDIPEDHGATQLELAFEQPCDSGFCMT